MLFITCYHMKISSVFHPHIFYGIFCGCCKADCKEKWKK